MENMNRVKKIEKYISDFFYIRYSNYRAFYRDENKHRKIGIYLLKEGTELMKFLYSIIMNIEEQLFITNLVPKVFATPEVLIEYIKWFKKYLEKNQNLLDINMDGEKTSYVIIELQEMKNDLVNMLDYLILIYDADDTRIPYQELRHSLITKDIDTFFHDMNSILASVSYPILKVKEGYLHSNIHLILKLLGFDIISEEVTNIGRIDAVIRLVNTILIFEFKLGTSEEALNQIKEKKYYEKFTIENKEIILIGVGFDNKNRNINDYKIEEYK